MSLQSPCLIATAFVLALFGTTSAVTPPLSHSTDELHQARYGISAVSVNDHAFFAGGVTSGYGRTTMVEDYAGGGFSSIPNGLSEARAVGAGTVVGDFAIFAGGTNPSPSDVVDVYNSTTGAWSQKHLSRSTAYLAAASLEGKAYFAGGRYADGSNLIWNDLVEVYDPVSDSWSTMTLSQGRGSLSAAAVDTKVLFAGGRASNGCLDTVDIYDAQTDIWSTATLSHPRSWMAATTVGSKVIFAGGYDDLTHSSSDVVDIYDAATGLWSTATLSAPRIYLTATTMGRWAFFGGGYTGVLDGSGYKSDVIDVYDSLTDTWSTLALSTPRSGMAATCVGDQVLFAGGSGPGGFSSAVDIFTIPEPSMLVLLALGATALLRRRSR